MSTRTRRGSVVSRLGMVLAIFILGTFGTSLRAQSIKITDPGNNSQTGPGVKFEVLGTYSFDGNAADNIKLRMWEVDENDNSVGDPKDKKSIDRVNAARPGGWGLGIKIPDQPARTTKRYKITAQLRSGTTVKSRSSIFVRSVASGGGP